MGKDKGPEREHYAVESSSPWRTRFDTRERESSRTAAGRKVSWPPSAQAGQHNPSFPKRFAGADEATPPLKREADREMWRSTAMFLSPGVAAKRRLRAFEVYILVHT